MAYTNPMKGKNFVGGQMGGEGTHSLKISHEPEFSGVYRSGPNEMQPKKGGHSYSKPVSETGINADLGTKDYGGPVRAELKPKDMGDCTPGK